MVKPVGKCQFEINIGSLYDVLTVEAEWSPLGDDGGTAYAGIPDAVCE